MIHGELLSSTKIVGSGRLAGRLDETSRLEPAVNPFEAKVLPMFLERTLFDYRARQGLNPRPPASQAAFAESIRDQDLPAIERLHRAGVHGIHPCKPGNLFFRQDVGCLSTSHLTPSRLLSSRLSDREADHHAATAHLTNVNRR